jgi:hypothetical protein
MLMLVLERLSISNGYCSHATILSFKACSTYGSYLSLPRPVQLKGLSCEMDQRHAWIVITYLSSINCNLPHLLDMRMSCSWTNHDETFPKIQVEVTAYRRKLRTHPAPYHINPIVLFCILTFVCCLK